MKFLLTIKSWTSSFIFILFIINTYALGAQSSLPDLSKVNKIEKKLNQFKSIKLSINATKDDYLSYVNNLELEIDLREKIKSQYIILESEILNTTEAPSLESVTTEKKIELNYNNLEQDVLSAVLKDKILQRNLKKEKKEDAIRAIYLNQVIEANKNSTSTLTSNKTTNTSQGSLDSLHTIVIQRIINQDDKIISLKESMNGAMDFLKQNTQVVKPNTQVKKSSINNTRVVSPFSQIVVNLQNVLRQYQNQIFKPDFAEDNKLIEDRKGFIPSPLAQGIKTLRYEESINGGKHDGVVFTSNSPNVTNISQGNVVKVGTSSNNKKYIVVKHDGDYMSVYTNLKQTYVIENQYIKFGQSIGEANLYNNDSYAIHFQMWKGSQSLNPSRWIKNN